MTSEEEQFLKSYRASQKECQSHPGAVASREWSNLDLVWRGVYWGNCRAIDSLCSHGKEDQGFIDNLVSNMGRVQHDNSNYELPAMMLHNFASAAATLVDHTRNLMKKQDNKDLVDEYAHKVKDLGKIEHIVFVKNLRNYFLHSDVPSLAITLNIVRDADGNDLETVDFSLGVDDDMLNWDGWHVNARSFLTKQMKQPNSKMNLQDLVRMHREDIDKLYHWLHREYMTVHKDAIGEANNLIIEHNRKMRDHAF